MPFLIMFAYLNDTLQSALHLRLEAAHIAVSLNGPNVIVGICKLLDVGIILAGALLLAIGWREGAGIALLLLHRTVQRLSAGMWIAELLAHLVDAGCLLLLLALRLSQRQSLEWHNKQQGQNLQRSLLLGRFGMCCEFLLWSADNHQVINNRFAMLCFILLLCGIRCKLMSSLAVLMVLWHDCWQSSWSHFFGWNDLTISLQLIAALLGKVAGFLLLAHLGGGKWSLDGII
ncbi:hypothetical protein KR222_005643 [Zaprionus bogoriensis]|nr:hypothetical protein KR222_005643 [Zaprionus bogoriensis]